MEKVTDPTKKVTDVHLAELLTKQGIDKDYMELFHDYAPRSKGKEYSPYARFYKDRKSNKRVMVVSVLPHCTADGHKIECGWYLSGGKYYSKANLFSAIIDGKQIKVTCLSDQPHGAKKNDWVQWNPQLFLNNVEQTCGEATLLTTDPINAGYFENTLEWDYGICKRRIRIIEGRIREKWVFASNPNGEIRIKHNHIGNYRLRLLSYKVNDDEELIPPSVFNEAEYPFEVMASPETFHPDPHVENTSVDGSVNQHQYVSPGDTWGDIRDGAGNGFVDATATDLVGVTAFNAIGDKWRNLSRLIILFDTSGLPDLAEISGAVFSLYGQTKLDALSITPNINVYKSTPFSNIALQNDDFVDVGAVALCATPITYAGWDTAGYNNFTLLDVDTDDFGYIPVDGVTKLGCRNVNYDVADIEPNWIQGQTSWLIAYMAEQGNTTKDPKLVVTYTAPTHYERSAIVNIGIDVSKVRLLGITRASSVLIGNLVTATKIWGIVKSASVDIGDLVSASRLLGTIRQSSVLIGNLVSAFKSWNRTETSSVLIGNLVSAIRLLGIIRQSSVLIGNLVTASKVWGVVKSASVLIGNLVSASGIMAYIRQSSVLIGNKVSAIRLWGGIRQSSVLIGNKVSAIRLLAIIRNSSVLIGNKVTASGLVAYIRLSSVLIGNLVTASRAIGIIRDSSVLIGALVSAVRLLGIIRASEVSVGVLASAIRLMAFVKKAAVIIGVKITIHYCTWLKKLSRIPISRMAISRIPFFHRVRSCE